MRETDDAGGLAIISGVFDDELLELADPQMRDAFYQHLAAQARAEQPKRRSLTRADLIAAALVLGLMFSATLPLSIPLYFLDDPGIAVFAMNVMGFAFLFIIGWYWADYTTIGRIKLGLALGSIALALTAVGKYVRLRSRGYLIQPICRATPQTSQPSDPIRKTGRSGSPDSRSERARR